MVVTKQPLNGVVVKRARGTDTTKRKEDGGEDDEGNVAERKHDVKVEPPK